ADPSNPIKSIDKVKSILGGGNDNLEFRFNDGDTFNMTNGIGVGGSNVVFTDYGSGKAPVLYWVGVKDYVAMIWASGTSDRVTVQNLTLQTKFTGSDKTSMPDAIKASGDNLVVRNNTFMDVGYAVNCNGKPDGVIVEKNISPTQTSLRSYFVWVAGNDHVILGNKVANSTREAVIRAVDANRILIGYNSFTNNTGDKIDTAKNTLTIHKGSYAYIVGNDLHKGPLHIGPLGEGDGQKGPDQRWNYAVVEGNILDTESFTLHGAQHVMYRNNISLTNGYPAYNIQGYNSIYKRQVVDATYVNNTGINKDADGIMFAVGSGTVGVTIQNNLYVAPDLSPGGNGAASPVYVAANDLSGFKSISNNVWASGKNGTWYAAGGVNYLFANGTKAVGFKTPAEWNSFAQVGKDIFSEVSMKGYIPAANSAAADAGMQVDGVFFDFYGNARPANGPITAGAVEV
ncbi:MAG TPA: hypothetical protein VHS31_08130, partial [Tepidisphaeraceae bacterium]|nr:hypothetical protein [Tepidisphaeraceae bacterium]